MPKRITVIRCESIARAREWFDSPEYRPLNDIRRKAANVRLLVVDGA